MFNSVGTFPVTIIDAMIAKPKFCQDQGAFDICLKVDDGNGQIDWWRGEMSYQYGKGSFSDKTQAEITMMTLQNIGWQHGQNLAQIKSLIGTQTTATTKQSSCGKYINIAYIGGGGNAPEELDPNDMQNRINALFGGGNGNNGGGFQQQQQPPQQNNGFQQQSNGFQQQSNGFQQQSNGFQQQQPVGKQQNPWE